jgi:peptide deformylase
MALREILIWPDPRLKQKAHPVRAVDAAVRKLCDDMAETMYESNGVGLAAPQIGVHQNVIAIDVEQKPKEGEPPRKKGEGLFFLIDPVIREADGEFSYTEGCLSIPDEYEEVTRFARIVVDFTGRDGKPHRLEAANNLLSVCVQHEMDHLMGKVFVDYLSPLKRDRIKTKMLKKTRDEQKR